MELEKEIVQVVVVFAFLPWCVSPVAPDWAFSRHIGARLLYTVSTPMCSYHSQDHMERPPFPYKDMYPLWREAQ